MITIDPIKKPIPNIFGNSSVDMTEIFNKVDKKLEEFKNNIPAGNGVPIVDSEDKLNPNAPQGSLGVVAYNTKKSVSMRDLYQPTTDDLDMDNGVIYNPEKLSKVDKLEFTFPEGNHTGDNIGIFIIPRTYSEQNPKLLGINITTSEGVVKGIVCLAMISDYTNYELCIYDENGIPLVNQENIDILNELLTTDDWCYFSSPELGFVITENQFDTLDMFVKSVSGVQATNLYINKPEGYKSIFDSESAINDITGDEKILINNDGKLSTITVTQILNDTNTRLDDTINDTNTKIDDTNTRLNHIKNNIKHSEGARYSDGVYAVTVDDILIDYNLADDTAIGVALVIGEHMFMIAKNDAANDKRSTWYWIDNEYDLSLKNYSTVDGTNYYGHLPNPDGTYNYTPHISSDYTTWTDGALSDFNGKDNTAIIAKASGGAMNMCTALKTFNASDSHNDWYIPACGQLALMRLNKTEINAALKKIGGTALADSLYWSSSEFGKSTVWVVSFDLNGVQDWSKKFFNKVRFIRDLSSISKRVSDLETSVTDLGTYISDLETSVSNLQSNTYSKEECDAMVTFSKYPFVDLGLPSGLKWATCNVGATKPEEYGLYFAWGETEGYSGITDEKGFYWGDYKFTAAATGPTDTKFSGLTKYNSDSTMGVVDHLETLEHSDDAASVTQSTCRMPTEADFKELKDNTISVWTSVNGVNGIQFTSKVKGYTNKSIFFPAAGECDSGLLNQAGSNGCYWSSSCLDQNLSNTAWYLYFNLNAMHVYGNVRFIGRSVRAVQDANIVNNKFSPTDYYTKSEIDNMIISTLNTEV